MCVSTKSITCRKRAADESAKAFGECFECFLNRVFERTQADNEVKKGGDMANITGIHGDPIGAIKHNLRERATYKNEDIDPERSCNNYIIESHGKDSGQIYSYYRSLVDSAYHRWKSTITAFNIAITKPDLPDDKSKDFTTNQKILHLVI